MQIASSAGVHRPDERLLRIAGPDARSWLGGQVTNDVRTLAPGRAVYTLILNARGKILSDATLYDRGDLAMALPRDRADAIREHLEAHLVMEDVELDWSDDVVATVQGPGAGEIVRGFEAHENDRLGDGGFDVLASAGEASAIYGALRERAGVEIDEASWEIARLRNARPRFGRDFGPDQYPQEAGLELRAVSFHKGCYLGQEVVCMLENRGQLTRRLALLEGAIEPSVGAALALDGKTVGQITSAARDPESGRTFALGYVKRAHANEGTALATEAGSLTLTGLAR
jgi:tRNA-modifying protein YgfZ